MKLSSKSALFLGLLSSSIIAGEYSSPLKNVEVHKTDLSTLSIQNHSRQKVELELYGEAFSVDPTSGISFECSGYKQLELQVKNNDHDYFEIPCQSRIVFTESFTNQYVQGE